MTVLDTHEVIARLRSFKEDLGCLRSSSQVLLRCYVKNKKFPLEERFQVWIDFCDKIYHERLDTGEVSPIGDWVEAGCDVGRYSRGADYDWDFFLSRLCDYHQEIEQGIMTEKEFNISKVPTVDEFKEILIAENFGSMCYDW